MVLGHLLLLFAMLIAVFSAQELNAQPKPAFSNFEYHVTEDGAFGLYKPKGWKVGTQKFQNGKMVFVTDREDLSLVNMIFLENIDAKHDSVTFAGATLRNVSGQTTGLKILEARSATDRMHTVVKYQRSGPQNSLIEGKYCFNVKRPAAVVFGYEAPAKKFKEIVPTLLTVISNITLMDDQAYQRLASQRKEGGAALLPMKKASAPDGTCSLLVPEGWNLTAGKGAGLCNTANGDSGFIFTVI